MKFIFHIFIFLAAVFPVRGQTFEAQKRGVLAPSADTYRSGYFALGGGYRLQNIAGNDYGVIPIFLLAGFSPNLEVGYEFHNIWDAGSSPVLPQNYSDLSCKYRFYGNNYAPIRLAAAGALRHNLFQAATQKGKMVYALIGLNASFLLEEGFNLHFNISAVTPEDADGHSLLLGTAADKNLLQDLSAFFNIQYTCDIANVNNNSLGALLNMKYYLDLRLQVVFGGGVSLRGGHSDMQVFSGLTFNSDVLRREALNINPERFTPPPLEMIMEEDSTQAESSLPVLPVESLEPAVTP